jgi:hypothetical protein
LTQTAYTELRAEKWDLLPAKVRRVIGRIESGEHVPLSDLVRIRGGIATLRDRLYFVQQAEDGTWIAGRDSESVIEPGLVRSLVRVSDFDNETELLSNRRGVIYPYQLRTGSAEILPESDLARWFPAGYAYLLSIREQLAQRDRGRKDYATWYAYGRAQGLVPLPGCLYTPIYAQTPRFLRSSGTKQELFCNGLALVLVPEAGERYGVDRDLLRALLDRSPVLRVFMRELGQNIAGGYAHYQPSLLRRFRVPQLDGERAAELLASSDSRRVELLPRLYGFSVDELTL